MKHNQAFKKNRHISNNIRLILDLLDYSELVRDDSYILFMDFYKAFDSIEHNFIFKTLEKIGLGDLFIKAIKTLCTAILLLNLNTVPPRKI